MAEPQVGMKFGAYLENGKIYEKKAAKASIRVYDRQKGQNQYDKIEVFTTTYYDKKGGLIASSTLETDGQNQKVTTTTEKYLYRGKGSIYDYDIKNNEIWGTKTHAIDLNKNGIVDKNEIFKN